MALMINVRCTVCDACISACKNNAIRKDFPKYVIDSKKCTECVGIEDEPQCMTVCIVDCIEPDPQWNESKEDLLAKYRRLHS